MNDDDFDELIKHLDPARDVDIPSPDNVRGQTIRARALQGSRRPRRIAVAIAAAIVLTGATAGAIVLWTGEPDVFAVACYAEADLDADRAQGDPRLGVGPEACAPLWQQGPFGDGPPPSLVACLVDGVVSVFPGPEGTCGDLGLPRSVGGETALATIAELDAALREVINVEPCPSPEEAVGLAQRIIDDLGLSDSGWTVRQITETIPERPCASFSVDEARELVAITPIP